MIKMRASRQKKSAPTAGRFLKIAAAVGASALAVALSVAPANATTVVSVSGSTGRYGEWIYYESTSRYHPKGYLAFTPTSIPNCGTGEAFAFGTWKYVGSTKTWIAKHTWLAGQSGFEYLGAELSYPAQYFYTAASPTSIPSWCGAAPSFAGTLYY